MRRNAPFTLTRHDGSGCRQLLAGAEVVPGLSCPFQRPDNPVLEAIKSYKAPRR